MAQLKRLSLLTLNLALAVTISLGIISCGDDDGASKPNEFETLRSHIDTLITDGKIFNLTDSNTTKSISDSIESGDATAGLYQIIDVRSSTDFAAGHVPGALNILWSTVADDGALSALSGTKTTVVYCKTSNTGAFSTTMLNILGYTSKNMKWGMMGYHDQTIDTTDGDGVGVANLFSTIDATVSKTSVATSTHDLPVIETGKSTAEEIAAAMYIALMATAPSITIKAADVKTIVDGQIAGSPSVTLSDTSSVDPSDYQIVSVRDAAYYNGTAGTGSDEGGHITGAINILPSELAKTESLQKLDPSKIQIVYCYTGHTGGISTAVLNVLGYNAKNLMFGMAAWTSDPKVNKGYTFSGAPNHEPIDTGSSK